MKIKNIWVQKRTHGGDGAIVEIDNHDPMLVPGDWVEGADLVVPEASVKIFEARMNCTLTAAARREITRLTT